MVYLTNNREDFKIVEGEATPCGLRDKAQDFASLLGFATCRVNLDKSKLMHEIEEFSTRILSVRDPI